MDQSLMHMQQQQLRSPVRICYRCDTRLTKTSNCRPTGFACLCAGLQTLLCSSRFPRCMALEVYAHCTPCKCCKPNVLACNCFQGISVGHLHVAKRERRRHRRQAKTRCKREIGSPGLRRYQTCQHPAVLSTQAVWISQQPEQLHLYVVMIYRLKRQSSLSAMA